MNLGHIYIDVKREVDTWLLELTKLCYTTRMHYLKDTFLTCFKTLVAHKLRLL